MRFPGSLHSEILTTIIDGIESSHCVIHCDIVASKGLKIEHQIEHTEIVGGIDISTVKTIVTISMIDKNQNEIHLRLDGSSRQLSQIIELLGGVQ